MHTGLKKRGFVGSKEMTWPTFKWSHDEKYFARLSYVLTMGTAVTTLK